MRSEYPAGDQAGGHADTNVDVEPVFPTDLGDGKARGRRERRSLVGGDTRFAASGHEHLLLEHHLHPLDSMGSCELRQVAAELARHLDERVLLGCRRCWDAAHRNRNHRCGVDDLDEFPLTLANPLDERCRQHTRQHLGDAVLFGLDGCLSLAQAIRDRLELASDIAQLVVAEVGDVRLVVTLGDVAGGIDERLHGTCELAGQDRTDCGEHGEQHGQQDQHGPDEAHQLVA